MQQSRLFCCLFQQARLLSKQAAKHKFRLAACLGWPVLPNRKIANYAFTLLSNN